MGGGAFEYIPKPFDLEEAIITVKKALEEHKETKPKKFLNQRSSVRLPQCKLFLDQLES